MDEIQTGRLVLRDLVTDDWRAIQDYARDPEVVRYLPWGPNSEGQTVDFVRATIATRNAAPMNRREFALGIVVKETDRLIGGVRITIQKPEHRQADIGYCLHRKEWGKGYATEAAKAIRDFGFGGLGMHRVYAICQIPNASSARVLEKIGMKREGLLREERLEKGEWRDFYLYAILHAEWKELKSNNL